MAHSKMPSRQAALFFFVSARMWGGMHVAAWRDPDAPADPAMDFERIKQMVQKAERAKLHGLFLADALALFDHMSHEVLARTSQSVTYEPFTLCSALAACTSKIGLALTANTTYNDPYHVARQFASLDHLSGGRVGWNVVAGGNRTEARNFSRTEHMEHSLRYERAGEFVDVVTGLWDSWEDDAFLRDIESGVFFDVDKLHPLNHEGEFFSVAGPLTMPRPVQGHPVIAQAGSSPDGLKFATRVGEIIFTHQTELEKSQKFYAEVKEQVAAQGRDPDHVLIISGIIVLLGRTQAEADEKLALYDSLTDPRVSMDRLTFVLDFDLSGYPIDGPVPEIPVTNVASQSMQRTYLEWARRDNLTIREFAKLVSHLGTIAATPATIADRIEEWVATRAVDGFNVYFADPAASFELFVDEVVPELQRRGVFQDDYRGSTFREYLGLPRPANRYAQAGGKAQAGSDAVQA